MGDLEMDKEISEMILNIYRIMRKSFNPDNRINLAMIQLHGLFFIKENKKCQLTDLARAFNVTLPTANSLV